jgi:hypothetical protein
MGKLSKYGPFGKDRDAPLILYTGKIHNIKVVSSSKQNGKSHTYIYFDDTETKCTLWNTN